METTLTAKRKRFCEEYVIDLNGTQAAIRAGYKKDYAKEQAALMLKETEVQRYVDFLQKRLEVKTDITAQKVLNEFAKIGFADIRDYLNDDLTMKKLSEIKNTAALSSIKVTKTTFGSEGEGLRETVEFKVWDKIKALENIGNHIGFFEAAQPEKINLALMAKIMELQNRLDNGDTA